MNFAIFGGDARFKLLADILAERGHGVRTCALGGGLGAEQAAAGADCVILPLPCQASGRLNAPFEKDPPPVERLLDCVARGTTVCAGNAGDAVRDVCGRLGLRLFDYFAREDFTLKNAELTAECALKLLLELPAALRGSRVLILGYGRIGRFLARKLNALGARVTVAARSSEQRALAEIEGCRAVGTDAIAGDYAAVVNTIPANIFGAEALNAIPGAALIELASPPYGFDRAAAAALGRDIALGSGLPGKIAPMSAAGIIADAILDIMEENK